MNNIFWFCIFGVCMAPAIIFGVFVSFALAMKVIDKILS